MHEAVGPSIGKAISAHPIIRISPRFRLPARLSDPVVLDRRIRVDAAECGTGGSVILEGDGFLAALPVAHFHFRHTEGANGFPTGLLVPRHINAEGFLPNLERESGIESGLGRGVGIARRLESAGLRSGEDGLERSRRSGVQPVEVDILFRPRQHAERGLEVVERGLAERLFHIRRPLLSGLRIVVNHHLRGGVEPLLGDPRRFHRRDEFVEVALLVDAILEDGGVIVFRSRRVAESGLRVLEGGGEIPDRAHLFAEYRVGYATLRGVPYRR